MNLFDIPEISIPIANSDKSFPVRRIYCIGRNYKKHAEEMGHDSSRSEPFYFCKPSDAIVPSKTLIDYPLRTEDLHHEIELVVAIDSDGKDIIIERARDHIFGYAVGH